VRCNHASRSVHKVNLPLTALQEQWPHNSERERYTCGSSCVPATWFGSSRERRGDRGAGSSHQRTGTVSIPPHKTVFQRTGACSLREAEAAGSTTELTTIGGLFGGVQRNDHRHSHTFFTLHLRVFTALSLVGFNFRLLWPEHRILLDRMW